MTFKINSIKFTIFTFLLSSLAVAESLPSAKFTGRVGGINILDSKNLNYTPIMKTTIKSASQKELAMNVALECGLFTDTLVKSSKGTYDASTAEAKVNVRVKVDGRVVAPGEIIFCSRKQDLMVKLGGILESCKDLNGDGTLSQDECLFTDEEIRLILTTMNANSFNFILGNVSSGVHEVVVEGKISTGTSAIAGSSEAKASIGKGSLIVNQVRGIQSDEF